MGKIVSLAEAQQIAQSDPKGQVTDWLYNALDCTGTREVHDTLHPRLNPRQAATYAFERAIQAPFMQMMLRGTRVDQYKRNNMVIELRREVKRDQAALVKLPQITEVWDVYEKDAGDCASAPARSNGKPGKHKWPRGVPDSLDKHCERCDAPRLKLKQFNPGSNTQKQYLLYTRHGVEPQLNKDGEVTTDGDALERIGRKYPKLKPLTEGISGLQDKNKQLGSLNARLTSDGRYPSSFNVGAAWTGRASSSKSPFGMGGNKQNVAPRHRSIFIPDPGKRIGYADYMQGESNIVAHLSGDEKYIEAHRLGDVHTFVTRYMFPSLPWTGDLAKDKRIAKQLPPWDAVEGHDYRFQCKRIVHGSNYGLTPHGIVMLYPDIPLAEAKVGWNNYMSEFDGIPAWQMHIKKMVEEHIPIVNPLGREWIPFGRPWDKKTWRQALSFLPQSLLADIENIAIWMVWRNMDLEGKVDLLAQVHDAILHQFLSERLDLERELLTHMSIPVPVTDINGVTRTMVIGVESAVGKNWGHVGPLNPQGIDEGPIAQYLKEHPII